MSTIDPGIGDGIKEKAEDVEDQDTHQRQGRGGQDTEDMKQPSKWWFASTACPLLAGTFGPIASGFNICALVYHWRQYIPPGGTQSTSEQAGQTLPDPVFVVALNAASLLCALVGNASLLLNMAQRVRFSTAQPTTIAGFLLAGILLIADLATLAASPSYGITRPEAIPHDRHSLTGAFYYAIFAAAIYVIIAVLMLMTVYGANRGHFGKEFKLTGPQRTLMLQTMSFVTYLLLGALIYSNIEGWEYLNAVYWADVTLLTVGLGEYSPSTAVGKGLLFPFAIGGILMIGLVVGSIRSLVLDRGKEKMSARIVEKKRSKATDRVDQNKQTIRISFFAKADFNTDPSLSQAERRKEEFAAMRKIQDAGERERRWFGLVTSGAFALLLWLVGAAIFQQTEYTQQWTYFQALYFSYTSLLTIGYGDFHPQSNSGKAFFVIWSQLAVPSLTILISNMGDTIVKWFSDITVSVATITVLPEEMGFRAGFKKVGKDFTEQLQQAMSSIAIPGLLGDASRRMQDSMPRSTHEGSMQDRLAKRLAIHAPHGADAGLDDDFENDVRFYHYVMARECRSVQKDLKASPAKRYSWEEWEYFLKLIGNEDDPEDFPGQEQPNILVSKSMKISHLERAQDSPPGFSDRDARLARSSSRRHLNADAEKPSQTALMSSAEKLPGSEANGAAQQPNASHPREHRRNHKPNHRHSHADDILRQWSWLSNNSPLMSSKSEAEWILDRLSAALERELNRQRRGYRRNPPISLRDAGEREEHAVRKGR